MGAQWRWRFASLESDQEHLARIHTNKNVLFTRADLKQRSLNGKPLPPAYVPCHENSGLPLDGGTVEKAQQMANHSDPRTTKLYDRRNDELTLDEIERILI